jgi:hemoglobin
VYWKGKCKDSLKKDCQLIVDFLGSAFGGPVTYLGRSMKVLHEGFGITDDEWRRFVDHVTATLRNLAIAERESSEFLAATESLKTDLVETSCVAVG